MTHEPEHCISPGRKRMNKLTRTNKQTNILWPLYRSTYVSQRSQLTAGKFCWSKVLLPHATANGN